MVTVTFIFFVSGTSDTTSNGYPALSATAHPQTATVSRSQPGFVSNGAITSVQGCTLEPQPENEDILLTIWSESFENKGVMVHSSQESSPGGAMVRRLLPSVSIIHFISYLHSVKWCVCVCFLSYNVY